MNLREELELSLQYIKDSNLDAEQLDFVNATIEYVISRYATTRTVHSCDIPGCASCGNPESSDDADYFPFEEEE